MFGYIKPYVPTLTVSQYEAYKAIYCGLCRSMGQLTGQTSRFTLSYDFAFLAVFRMAIERIPSKVDRKACIAHPFGRRAYIKDNDALRYCAAACAILTRGKIDDNIRDEKGFKKLTYSLLSPMGTLYGKRAGEKFQSLSATVNKELEELTRLETGKCDSVDEAAAPFARILSEIFAFGLEGKERRIAETMGASVGKFIYAIDACDDISSDIKGEKYNPIRFMYQDPLEYNNEKKKNVFKKDIADSLYTALGLEINRAYDTLDYMDFEDMDTYRAILENILTVGMRSEAARVLYGSNKNENPLKRKFH